MIVLQQPLTAQWDQRNGKGYAYNTDTSLVPFARTVIGDAPDQITITYQVNSEIACYKSSLSCYVLHEYNVSTSPLN